MKKQPMQQQAQHPMQQMQQQQQLPQRFPQQQPMFMQLQQPQTTAVDLAVDRALEVARKHSQFSKLAPQYEALFRQLWKKHAGDGRVHITAQAARSFAADMVAGGWKDWELSAQDNAVLDRFTPVGGMHVVSFAEFSENDDFDADAHLQQQAEITGVATAAHQSWLQQGAGADVALRECSGDHDTVVIDWGDTGGRAAKLVEALRRDGVAVLTNALDGPMAGRTLTRAADMFRARREMAQADIERMQHELRHRPMMKAPVGYTDIRVEQLNPYTPPDFKETFDFAASNKSPVTQRHMGQLVWPKEGGPRAVPAGFRTDCEAYLGTTSRLAEDVVAAIAQGLGLPSDVWKDKFDDPLVVGRLLRYPPQASAAVPQEMGAGSHVDYGAVTLIVEESAGLQMQSRGDGRWQRVGHVPGGVIVQTGFAMEKMTNGALMAARHRVRNDGVADRHAAVLFYDPTPTATIGPHPKFVSAKCPPRYDECVAGKKGVRFGDPRYLLAAAAR